MNIKFSKYMFTGITVAVLTLIAGVNSVSAKAQAIICHEPGTLDQITMEVFGGDIGTHINHGDSYGECIPFTTTAPVITRLGDKKIVLKVGDTFIDPGVTAYDNEDGDITSNVVVAGDVVNTSVKGKYIITYNVIDSDGLSSKEVKRKVRVKKK